jgi:hypothetical protein
MERALEEQRRNRYRDAQPPELERRLLMQRDLPLSNADGGSVLEYNLVIEDY